MKEKRLVSRHGLRAVGSRIAQRPRQRRWGSRFFLAATTTRKGTRRSFRQEKWWGPVVLEAAAVPCHTRTCWRVYLNGTSPDAPKARRGLDARGGPVSGQ